MDVLLPLAYSSVAFFGLLQTQLSVVASGSLAVLLLASDLAENARLYSLINTFQITGTIDPNDVYVCWVLCIVKYLLIVSCLFLLVGRMAVYGFGTPEKSAKPAGGPVGACLKKEVKAPA